MPPYVPRKRSRSASPAPRSTKKAFTVPPKKPTLFDDLDAGTSTSQSPASGVGGKKKKKLRILSSQPDSSDESDLSSLSSTPEVTGPNGAAEDEDDDDDDDDIEFEDVATAMPTPQIGQPTVLEDDQTGDLDLTLTKDTRISLTNPHGTKKGPSKIERQIRVSTHNLHVQFLLWHNAIRNAWVCDKQVHTTLLKQLPPGVEKEIQRWKIDSGIEVPEPTPEKSKKHKGKTRNAPETHSRSHRDWGAPAERLEKGKVNLSRGDPLIRLLKILSAYWRKRFRVTAPGLRKLGYMSLERLDEETKSFHKDEHDPERHGERIRNLEEFRQLAKRCEGSRDVGAQLFTALLRAIGLESRLIASLQPVGFSWTKAEEASPQKKKKEAVALDEDNDDTESGSEDESEESRAKSAKMPKLKMRQSGISPKTRSSGIKDEPIEIISGDESEVEIPNVSQKPSKTFDKDLLYPHYWSEVLSPVTNKYLPVDAIVLNTIATNEELLAKFEPRNAKAEKAKQVIAYVVGYSPDGTAKDVTVRYLKRHMFPGKTKGMRVPVEKIPIYNSSGKVKKHEEYDWFKHIMSGYVRAEYRHKGKNMLNLKQTRTEVDDLEDATDLKPVKPEKKEVKEGEETLQSYKASAEFVLERHLRREEALLPHAKHVKLFTVKGKGSVSTQEKVYRRKDVVHCKSVETWHKEGRAPKEGEQPLKMVPYRAATTNRRRELAEAEAATGEKMLQGLYSWDQTDWIIPPPIENGVIPKNAYGNMDVYVPSMIPQGAVHLPYRGMARICRKLNLDYAEAVTGFEFGHRMAVPVIQGVVVAEENQELVLEQWEVEEAERIRKEDEKRTKAALSTWRKFLMGMRIIERVRDEYGDDVDDTTDVVNPWTNRSATARKEQEILEEGRRQIMDRHDEDMAGGFFPEGHNEEEAGSGGFFVARHDDEDEDDEAGGFIVDHGDDYSNPQTVNKAGKIQIDAQEEFLAPDTETDHAAARSKSMPEAKGVAKKSIRSTSLTAKGRARKRLIADSEEEDDADGMSDSSDLSELSSALDSEPDRKVSEPEPEPEPMPSRRAMPRRNAARKSNAALRSHYFQHDIEEEEDDDA